MEGVSEIYYLSDDELDLVGGGGPLVNIGPIQTNVSTSITTTISTIAIGVIYQVSTGHGQSTINITGIKNFNFG